MAIGLTRLRSIHSLCKGGLGKDALILLRVLLEDTVTFNYIHNDKRRVKDFIDFDHYQRLRLVRNISTKHIENKEKFDARTDELKQLWGSVKDRFLNKEGRIFDTWSGKNLRVMAQEVGGEEVYDLLYRYASDYVHLNSITLNSYVVSRDSKGVTVEIGTSHYLVPEVIITTCVIMVDSIIKTINDEYRVGFDSEIVSVSKEIEGLKI
jgi:hypothetical protein